MAFSTQKDFLKIGFLNERLEPVCAPKPGVKLKSYVSCTDSRAWAMNKEKQAHYLTDLVACRNYLSRDQDSGQGDGGGDGVGSGGPGDTIGDGPGGSVGSGSKSGSKSGIGSAGGGSVGGGSKSGSKSGTGIGSAGGGSVGGGSKSGSKSGIGSGGGGSVGSGSKSGIGSGGGGGAVTGPDSGGSSGPGGSSSKVGPSGGSSKVGPSGGPSKVGPSGGPSEVGPSGGPSKVGPSGGSSKVGLSGGPSKVGPSGGPSSVGPGGSPSGGPGGGSGVGSVGGLGASGKGNCETTDSLIGHARTKLEDIEQMIDENNRLREKLDMANERNSILEDENQQIKNIVKKETDPDKLTPFHDKVRELRAQGKITEEDVDILFKLQLYVGCKDKEYKILEAENNCLKRLVEKLAARAKVNRIPTEKETSTDIDYLQNLVNDLRDEIAILRNLEDANSKLKLDFDSLKSRYNNLSSEEKETKLNKDAQRMDAIIKERNSLRDQLAKMIAIEDKIAMLKKRALEADQLEKELENCKVKINELEKYSQNAAQSIDNIAKDGINGLKERDNLKDRCSQLECDMEKCCLTLCKLKEENEFLKGELQIAHCQLQKMQCMEQELINSKKQLGRCERALEDYECQMHQLMEVIEELEARTCFCCCNQEGQDGGGQGGGQAPKDGHVDDIIKAIKLCLIQLQKECEARSKLQQELKSEKSRTSAALEQASHITTVSNNKCADLEAKLKQCQAENQKLIEKVESMGETVSKVISETQQEVENIADNCCKELELLRDEMIKEREKCEKEKADLKGELRDMKDLYQKAREDCEKGQQDMNKEKELNDKIQEMNEDCEKRIAALNNGIDEQKELLQQAKDQLDKYMEQLGSCEKKAQDLEDENKRLQSDIDGLRETNAELDKMLKDKDNEITALNGKITGLEDELAALQAKLKDQAEAESRYQNQISNLENSLKNCNDELERLRAEKADLQRQLAQKDGQINDALSQLQKCKADIDGIRSELQNKIDDCLKEKQGLQAQVDANKNDLEKLNQLIRDIEDERQKNKLLQDMVQDFENKLKEVPTDIPQKPTDVGDIQQQQREAMDAFKSKLEQEAARANSLQDQLNNCLAALAAKSAEGAQQGVTQQGMAQQGMAQQGVAQPLQQQGVPQQQTQQVTQQVTQDATPGKQLAEKDRDKAESLNKLQNIHDKQWDDLLRNHEKEIEALKLANSKLRDSLMNLKQKLGAGGEEIDVSALQEQIEELKKGVCTCSQKQQKSTCPLTKLQEICMKIVEQGIECLDLKELTYLHSEVYKAGLKLRPDLRHQKDQRCCKCTGFTCCLPAIPKDAEKKLLNRITSLEGEVDTANNILQHLKQCMDKKKSSTRSTGSVDRRYKQCRVNDEINEFLKRTSDGHGMPPECTEIYRRSNKSMPKRACDYSRRD